MTDVTQVGSDGVTPFDGSQDVAFEAHLGSVVPPHEQPATTRSDEAPRHAGRDYSETNETPSEEPSDTPEGPDVTPANAYPEPRPLTIADQRRTAIMAHLNEVLYGVSAEFNVISIRDTAAKSVVLEFSDHSTLLIQAAALTSDNGLEYGDFADSANTASSDEPVGSDDPADSAASADANAESNA